MSVKWVEGTGWVMDGGIVLESPEHKAMGEQYAQSVREFQDGLGQWDQYRDGTIADLASRVDGDHWWYARMHEMANQVANGDKSWFSKNFPGRYAVGDGRSHNAREMINRYLALKNGGHSDAEIMRGIYGEGWGTNKASDWNLSNDTQPTGASGPSANGGGMLGGPITPGTRQQRKGVWGGGYKDGGYSLLGEENQAMRKAIGEQLEKKLLG